MPLHVVGRSLAPFGRLMSSWYYIYTTVADWNFLMEQTPTELQDLTLFANYSNALSPNVFRLLTAVYPFIIFTRKR